MKNALWTLLGLLSMGVLQAQEHNVSYESLWNSVAQLERQDLPQSKLKVLGQLMEKSLFEKNRAQGLRAAWEMYQTSVQVNRRAEEKAYEVFCSYGPFFREHPASHAAFLCLDLDLGVRQGRVQERPALLRSALDTLLVMRSALEAESPAPYDRLLSYMDSRFQAQTLYQQVLLKLMELTRRLRYGAVPWMEETYWHLIQDFRETTVPGSANYLHAQCLYIAARYAQEGKEALAAWEELIAAYPEKEGIAEAWVAQLDLQVELARQELYALEAPAEADLQRAEAAYQRVLDQCMQVIKQFPSGRWTSQLKEIQKDLQRPALYLHGGLPSLVYPREPLDVVFRYTNLPSVAWTLYRLPDRYTALPNNLSLYNTTDRAQLLRLGTLLESGSLPLKKSLAVEREGRFHYAFDRPGTYLLYLGHGAEAVYEFVQVSHVATATRRRQGNWELYCTDLQTGRPLDQVRLTGLQSNGWGAKPLYSPTGQAAVLNMEGFTPLPWAPDSGGELCLRVAAAGEGFALDSSAPPVGVYGGSRVQASQQQTYTVLCTDRKLYRPGDSLWVKGLQYTERRFGPHEVARNKKLKVFLLGPSSSVPVDTFEVVTNAMGSFSLQLQLPSGGMNGQYSLRCAGNYAYFRVEEYVNPTFEVTMEPVKEAYAFDMAVAPQGKLTSYTGLSMAGTRVDYEVYCKPLICPWFGSWFVPVIFAEVQVAQGQAVADAHGNFLCPFTLSRPQGRPLFEDFRCAYEVVVRATDATGESRQARTSLYVGDIPYVLHSNVRTLASGGPVLKERAGDLVIEVSNLAGEAQALGGTYRLCQGDSCVVEGRFTGGEALPLRWAELPSGALRLEYGLEYKGRRLQEKEDFLLVGLTDRTLPVDTTDFFHPLSGEALDFLLGTSEDSLYVLLELFDGDSLLQKELRVLTPGLERVRLPWPAGATDHVNLSLYYIRKGKGVQHRHTVRRPRPLRDLALGFQALRETYLPGTQQSFSLWLRPQDSLAPLRPAEALVAIFDKATEQFGKSYWHLPRFCYEAEGLLPTIHGPEAGHSAVLSRNSRAVNTFGAVPMMMKTAAAPEVMAVADEVAFEGVLESADRVSADGMDAGLGFEAEAGGGAAELPALRSDFAQTLLFAPHLRSDSTGRVQVDFRTSDVLSTFVVKVLAHTADMYSGQTEASFVVRKDLMAQAHLPAFLRAGDRLELQLRVGNLTPEALRGTARIQCFDGAREALTPQEVGRRVLVQGQEAKELTLEAGETRVLSWTLQAPPAEDLPLLGLRLWFEAGDQADGEEHLLPILSSKERLSLSRLYMMEAGALAATDLDSLRAEVEASCRQEALRGLDGAPLEDTRLQLRITDPLREALTALPALVAPQADNLMDWTSALYAAQVGSKLLREQPVLRAYVEEEQARLRAGGPRHRLELNQELTGILLDQTPWGDVPALEAQRIERLASLADPAFVERIRSEASACFARLQASDGGLAWFPQMGSSWALTLYWLENLYRLREAGALDWNATEREQVAKAWGYADGCLEQWHKDLLEQLARSGRPRPTGLQPLLRCHLRLRTLALQQDAHIPLSAPARKAYDELVDMLASEAEPDRDLMDKALTAEIWSLLGREDLAEATLASLTEYAVEHPNLGMYFPRAVQSPWLLGSTLRAHALLLERFHRRAARHPEAAALVQGLQQWLVLQKENQQWSNGPATCDVVQALLTTGAAEARGPQFVSFFYEYTRPAAGVEAFGEGMEVERSFYKAQGTGEDLEWVPLAPGEVLETGQKLRMHTRMVSTEIRDFVLLRLALPANLRPQVQTSGMVWFPGHCAYREVRAHSLYYHFPTVDSKAREFEEDFVVTQRGCFTSGLCRIQCLYAPQYQGHAGPVTLESR